MKEIKKFTVEVEMNERWIPHFLGMLQKMQGLGNVGSSRYVCMFADGDGDFHPRFKWNIESEIGEPKKLVRPLEIKNGNSVFDAG